MFMIANIFKFNITSREFTINNGVTNELLNCYNNAKYKYIYTENSFSGVLMDIYFSSKYGFFKHCLIVAPSLPENKKEMILKKKQDIIYFQFDPIIHPGFREKTLPSTYLMMAHYPPELREKDSAFANSLFSTNLILLHYNEF